MTEENELQLNASVNYEQDDQLSADEDNLSDLSASSAFNTNQKRDNEVVIEEAKTEDPLSHVNDRIDAVLHVNNKQDDDDDETNDTTNFIRQAKQQGFNCLDLSKKNIQKFPSSLLEFPALQYLYLEGNHIAQLPNDLFIQLPNLKWIDLRNNKLTDIPSDGLDRNTSLRYLLLSGNLIRRLPFQLGKIKGLSALNLDGNPLEHPPLDIVKQGIKAIQQYLRDEHMRQSKCSKENVNDEEDDYFEEQQTTTLPDVWASSDDENNESRRLARSHQVPSVFSRPSLSVLRKSKSETSHYKSTSPNPLPTHLQSCIRQQRVSYSEMRMHPSSIRRRAKLSIKLPRVKTKPVIKKNNQPIKTKVSYDPVGDAYAARAHEEQRLIVMKHRNMKINEELQKVKTKEFVDDWKDDYRSSQQKLRQKRLVKGQDYPEAVAQAPFGIDPHYVSVMDKDQQEMVERAVQYEARRNRSPESAMREEEERRIRDKQIQQRIREITTKIMSRRGEVRGNALEEKRQAEIELRELRKLEGEIKQRRAQIDSRFKAYTGEVKARKKL